MRGESEGQRHSATPPLSPMMAARPEGAPRVPFFRLMPAAPPEGIFQANHVVALYERDPAAEREKSRYRRQRRAREVEGAEKVVHAMLMPGGVKACCRLSFFAAYE